MMFPTSCGQLIASLGHVGNFGDKFRRARESKDLSFDDVSNVTKISTRMLQAIEEEHFDLLPGGVFNKGFIRAYAKHLGLDDEEAVTDYLACLRQAQIDAQTWEPERPAPTRLAPPNQRRVAEIPKPVEKPQVPVQVKELPDLQLPRAQDVRPPRREFAGHAVSEIPWRLVAVAALVVVLGIFLWIRHARAPRTQTATAAQPAAANVGAAPNASAPAPAPAKQPPSSLPRNGSATSVSSSSPAVQPPLNQPAAGSHPATLASPTPAAATQEHDVNKNDVTIRSFGSSATKSSQKPARAFTLVIRATENTWISVFADGQLVTQETLIAPANTSVHAYREIVARIGNAAGASFVLNGSAISPQGNEAEAITLVFDASGLKSASPQPPSSPN